MKLHFHCPPIIRMTDVCMRPLVFSWDPDTGEVDGADASLVLEMARWRSVDAHPGPWSWLLSAEPLKSWADMAAIVGSEWVLPPVLAPHYPKQQDN